jgi:hypothetical protein
VHRHGGEEGETYGLEFKIVNIQGHGSSIYRAFGPLCVQQGVELIVISNQSLDLLLVMIWGNIQKEQVMGNFLLWLQSREPRGRWHWFGGLAPSKTKRKAEGRVGCMKRKRRGAKLGQLGFGPKSKIRTVNLFYFFKTFYLFNSFESIQNGFYSILNPRTLN